METKQLHNPKFACFYKFIFLVYFSQSAFSCLSYWYLKVISLFHIIRKYLSSEISIDLTPIWTQCTMYDFITGLFNFWQFLYCPMEPQWESHKHLNRGICWWPCFPPMTAINSSTKWGWDTLIPVPKRVLFTAHQHTVLWTIWLIALWQLVFSNPDRCSLT